MWSEYIAYHIATVVNIEVPRCFIGIDPSNGEMGVLIEFFFGYPDELVPARLLHGADLLNLIGVERSSDRPHSVRTNIRLCARLGIREAIEWWAKTLTFDALIGNTDRHPENWGLLRRIGLDGQSSVQMAPAFDNGTSLSYEVRDANIPNLLRPEALEAYVTRGKHHCGWENEDGGSISHILLCARIAEQFPQAVDAMRRTLAISNAELDDILHGCVSMPAAVPFNQARANLLAELTRGRRDKLTRALGG